MTKLKDEIIKINDTNVIVTMEDGHTLNDDDKKHIENLVKEAIKEIDGKEQ